MLPPNTLVVINVLVYPDSTHKYTQQLPANFSYINDIMFVNSTHYSSSVYQWSHAIWKQLDWLCWNFYPGPPLIFWFLLPTMTPPLCNGAIAVIDIAKEPLPEFPKLSMKELRAAEWLCSYLRDPFVISLPKLVLWACLLSKCHIYNFHV